MCQDTLNTKDKYFSIPLDFSRSSYAFSYGSHNKWELTFDFNVRGQSISPLLDSDSDYDYFHYFTYTNTSEDDEAIYDWVHTEGEVEFTRYRERESKPHLNYSLSLGYKKFFFSVENDLNSRSFYIHSKMNYKNSKTSKDNYTEYINIGYQVIDQPDIPEEGDVYGEIYNEQIDKTILYTRTYNNENDSYSISLAIGHRYDIKHELFKIPKLFFGLDITYLTLNLKSSQSLRSRSIDYNNDIYGDYHDYETYDKRESTHFFFEGPEINLYLKYFFY